MGAMICKFKCVEVAKRVNPKFGIHGRDQSPAEFIWYARFTVVQADSVENRSFFASNPVGSMEIGVMSEDRFIPGQEYYLEFRPVVKAGG